MKEKGVGVTGRPVRHPVRCANYREKTQVGVLTSTLSGSFRKCSTEPRYPASSAGLPVMERPARPWPFVVILGAVLL